MSRAAERELIDSDKARRKAVAKYLEKRAPEDPLLELAYWSHVLDLAGAKVYDAAARAREAGHGWPAVAMAYGERTVQAAHSKFAKITG